MVATTITTATTKRCPPSQMAKFSALFVGFPWCVPIFMLIAFLSTAAQPVSAEKVDTTTLTGKVMCGYQGWFSCPGDGMDLGWMHWARKRRKPFAPGNAGVDLWPDVAELGPEERFATGFKHGDGRVAEVFSSANRATVSRHFEWMRDYGIDGAFLQRFANDLEDANSLRHKNAVLSHVRDGTKRSGRAYAVMYDLGGLRAGEVDIVRKDWEMLRNTMGVTQDRSYLHHQGRPVVAVWGVGFGGEEPAREYTLAECRALVMYLKRDGCTVMLGVPTGWREGDRDAADDPLLREIVKLADVVSPWTVGRYRNLAEIVRHTERRWKPDLAWCGNHGLDYMPVVFPGFSWHNLHGGALDQIPRAKGEFLWSQMVAVKRAGCEMIYVAMFDEVDEGTAIFKCTNDPPSLPSGASGEGRVGDGVSFLANEGLPSDHYLRLTGLGGRMLRGEIPVIERMPENAHN